MWFLDRETSDDVGKSLYWEQLLCDLVGDCSIEFDAADSPEHDHDYLVSPKLMKQRCTQRTSLEFDPHNACLLLAGTDKGRVELYDTSSFLCSNDEDNRVSRNLYARHKKCSPARVVSTCWYPQDASMFAALWLDQHVGLFDTESGECVLRSRCVEGVLRPRWQPVQARARTTLLAVATGDPIPVVMDMTTGMAAACLGTSRITGHSHETSAVAWQTDTLLWIGDRSGRVLLWDVRKPEAPVLQMDAHVPVPSVATPSNVSPVTDHGTGQAQTTPRPPVSAPRPRQEEVRAVANTSDDWKRRLRLHRQRRDSALRTQRAEEERKFREATEPRVVQQMLPSPMVDTGARAQEAGVIGIAPSDKYVAVAGSTGVRVFAQDTGHFLCRSFRADVSCLTRLCSRDYFAYASGGSVLVKRYVAKDYSCTRGCQVGALFADIVAMHAHPYLPVIVAAGVDGSMACVRPAALVRSRLRQVHVRQENVAFAGTRIEQHYASRQRHGAVRDPKAFPRAHDDVVSDYDEWTESEPENETTGD